MGRAALILAKQGTRVIVGNHVDEAGFVGFVAHPGQWIATRTEAVDVVFDRFTSHRPRAFYDALQAAVGPVPIANGLAMNSLCRDKLMCQRVLESAGLELPAVEERPEQFEERLSEWTVGFIKPRFGQCGEGVHQVRVGMAMSPTSGRCVDNQFEPNLLQRAVKAPEGWAGMSVRVLTQRAPGGQWVTNPAVVRRSASDPVANVSRGAEVMPAVDVLPRSVCDQMDELARRACVALSMQPGGRWFIDAGVDLVIGRSGEPYLIEVNSRPWGRVKALAGRWPTRFSEAHEAACRRPLEYLSWWLSSGRTPALTAGRDG